MDRTPERHTSLFTSSESIEESKSAILMVKVKELYEKLEQQITDNEALLEENQKLKIRVSELQNKQVSSHPDVLAGNTNPVFNMFIDKITLLQNQNRKLKQQKQRSTLLKLPISGVYDNQSSRTIKRPPSINEKYMTPQHSMCYFTAQDQNSQIPCNPCYSPRYSSNISRNLPSSSRKCQQIDKLWLSPNRKNLQKIISKNRL